jgi:hypothetical protein
MGTFLGSGDNRMVSRRTLLRFGGGYGLSVVTGGLISIAVIPAVIIVAGAQTWAAIAVAQGVAGFGYIAVAAGWGVTGPTDVADAPTHERGTMYLGSLVTRTWLFLFTLIPTAVLAVLLAHSQPAVVILALASGLLAGLSAGWFFVGEGSPIRFLLLETLPRNVGAILGAVLLIATGNALWYVGAQAAGAIVATVLSSMSILRRYRGSPVSFGIPESMRRLRGHTASVSMSVTASVYVNLPIVVVQLFLPAATPVYALAERIMRLALYSTRPFVQISQGYVPASDRAERSRRAFRVVWLATVLCAAGGLAYALAAPFAGDLLSGSTLAIPFVLSIPMAVALTAMLLSQVTGFACLTAFGLTRTLATSTVGGAIAGVCTLVPFALLFGVDGVAWALGASELVVLVVQLWVLRPYLSRRARLGERPPVDA